MFNLQSNFVHLKDEEFLQKQRVAGKCVSNVLNSLQETVEKYGSYGSELNLKDLENMTLDIMSKNNCEPTFFGYKGFSGALCLSVNNELVHGKPRDYFLQSGDILKIDVGTTYKNAIADAARTCIFGEVKHSKHLKMIEVCKNALEKGIQAIKVGNQIGEIGAAISKYVKNLPEKFGLITQYGGHHVGENLHEFPFIANESKRNEGIRIQAGMSLAIEPLLCLVNNCKTVTSSEDKWTVSCADLCAHFEDTVFVHKDRVEILTNG